MSKNIWDSFSFLFHCKCPASSPSSVIRPIRRKKIDKKRGQFFHPDIDLVPCQDTAHRPDRRGWRRPAWTSSRCWASCTCAGAPRCRRPRPGRSCRDLSKGKEMEKCNEEKNGPVKKKRICSSFGPFFPSLHFVSFPWWKEKEFFLTLQGRDVVAPELGLLGEGSVVGVQLHVHLADSSVACSHLK